MSRRDDVAELAAALSQVAQGLERARRRIPDAARLALLAQVAEREPAQPSELAAALDVDRSLVSRQLQQLADAGLIETNPGDEDRRTRYAALTPGGRAELDRLYRFGVDRFALFVEDWPIADVREFTRLLRAFRDGTAQYSRLHPKD